MVEGSWVTMIYSSMSLFIFITHIFIQQKKNPKYVSLKGDMMCSITN